MVRLLLFLFALALASPAAAHTRSQSTSHWRIDGDVVRVRVEAEALDATRLYALGDEEEPLGEKFRRHAGAMLALKAGDAACVPEGAAHETAAPVGRVAAELVFNCPAGRLGAHRVVVSGRLFLDVAANHLHFVSVSDGEGRSGEAILTDAHRTAAIDIRAEAPAESAWQAFWRFVPVGSGHVFGGLDHLAFILALALLAGRASSIALAATGFTIGHTATLALAALGVVAPHQATVEALIGFTVAFVALEASGDGRSRMSRWSVAIALVLLVLAGVALTGRMHVSAGALAGLAVFAYAFPRGFRRGASAAPWLAAVFGLVHGCGFAGALGDLDLPRPHLLSALAGFNVGVELAQATVVIAALAAAFLFRRVSPTRVAVTRDLLAAGLFGLGVFWFVSRTLSV